MSIAWVAEVLALSLLVLFGLAVAVWRMTFAQFYDCDCRACGKRKVAR